MSFKLFFAVFFTTFFMECKEDPPQPVLVFKEGKGTLAIGQIGLFYTKNDSVPVKIKLIKVTEDSRCPKGAHCIWAGVILADVLIDNEYLNTADKKLDSFKNKKIYISAATPSPEINISINQKEYKIEFTVEKL